MNTMMLASRLTAKLKVRNVAALVAEDAVTLLDAMNGGLKEWFDGLPPKNKQTQVAETIHAPVHITLGILDGAKGFAYVAPPFPVGGYANEEALIGKSVTFGTDAMVNRLDKPSTLLKPYFGVGGDVVATFWGDAVGFPETSVRLVTPPRWEGEGETTRQHTLMPMSCSAHEMAERPFESGPPVFYKAGPIHPTLRSHPMWALRLWPLPNLRGMVTFTLETTPPVFGLDALQTPEEIPVPDHDVLDVIPLCEDRLTGTQLWADGADRQKAWADAERSRNRLAAMWIPLDAAPACIPALRHW